MKGIYIALAELAKPAELETRRGKIFTLEKGYYAYVGSALGGLEQRVARHLSTRKKHHWHVDYLLDSARVEKVIGGETDQKKECSMAQALSLSLTSVSGFGCSDCRCFSHLFFSADLATLEKLSIDAFRNLGLSLLVLHGR